MRKIVFFDNNKTDCESMESFFKTSSKLKANFELEYVHIYKQDDNGEIETDNDFLIRLKEEITDYINQYKTNFILLIDMELLQDSEGEYLSLLTLKELHKEFPVSYLEEQNIDIVFTTRQNNDTSRLFDSKYYDALYYKYIGKPDNINQNYRFSYCPRGGHCVRFNEKTSIDDICENNCFEEFFLDLKGV